MVKHTLSTDHLSDLINILHESPHIVYDAIQVPRFLRNKRVSQLLDSLKPNANSEEATQGKKSLLTSCTKNSICPAPETEHTDMRSKKKLLHLFGTWVELLVMIESLDYKAESFELFLNHVEKGKIFVDAL